eukprot:9007919-Pyramimonas_sp.AAC.1
MEAAVRGEAMHAEYAALNVQVTATWTAVIGGIQHDVATAAVATPTTVAATAAASGRVQDAAIAATSTAVAVVAAAFHVPASQ